MFIVAGLIGLLARRRVGLDIGGGADPYMRRRYVIPRNRIVNIYCHQILRDDADPALHDHPWPNLSIVLSGGYREIVFARRHRHGWPLPETVERVRRPGSIVLRRATTAHRLALQRDGDGRPIPAWTLFVTGPVLRQWGFWCSAGRWVHWRLFTAGERGELIGAGCGEGLLTDMSTARPGEAGRTIELRGNVYPLREAIGLDRQEAAERARLLGGERGE